MDLCNVDIGVGERIGRCAEDQIGQAFRTLVPAYRSCDTVHERATTHCYERSARFRRAISRGTSPCNDALISSARYRELRRASRIEPPIIQKPSWAVRVHRLRILYSSSNPQTGPTRSAIASPTMAR